MVVVVAVAVVAAVAVADECTNVCLHKCMHVRMYGIYVLCVGGLMDGWMVIFTYVRSFLCVHINPDDSFRYLFEQTSMQSNTTTEMNTGTCIEVQVQKCEE